MNKYLNTQTLAPFQIKEAASKDTGIILVIPCYYDEVDILQSLDSLRLCTMPSFSVEVITVVNYALPLRENMEADAEELRKKLAAWNQKNSSPKLRFYSLFCPRLPKKHGGVGMARKLGMDEAAYRFESIENPKGLILCFDADSACAPNYLQAVENHFETYTKSNACSIHFEHPLEGTSFSSEIYQYITAYELHLRYYINALRFAGFPYAYQTIGSSMAVRSNAYQAQGGMNKRKAGEDFYFLQKFIPLGNFTELNLTTVIPSPRPSHRVPFGTGKAIADMLADAKAKGYSYNYQSFIDLKAFFDQAPKLYSLESLEETERFLASCPKSIQAFILAEELFNKLAEVRKNSSSPKVFFDRFFRWLTAFKMLKFVHFARDEFYPDMPVDEAAAWLLEKRDTALYEACKGDFSSKNLLLHYRTLDKKGWESPIYTV